jgi:PAS domain S-box-containing protein
MPIRTAQGAVIGSFALSSFENRAPDRFHRKLLEIGAWIVGIVLDRSRSEETLRLLGKAFDYAEEGIMITDAEQRVVSVNRAVGRLLGYDPDEVIGRTPGMFASGRHDRAFYADMWADIVAHGHWSGEIWNRRKDGTVLPEWLSISAVKDPDDAVSHYIGIFSDISERIAAAEAMREKTEMLVQSNADLEQFAYVASHDLQTPLRNVMNYTQLLERTCRGRLGGDAEEFISFIVDGSRKMMGLITDLLEYSRVANQRRPLHPVSATDAVAQAIVNLKREIDAAGAELCIGDLPAVMAEQSLLVSLFQNLIGNSIKYRAPGRPLHVTVDARRQDSRHWRLTVTDNGIGIAPAYHEKVFEIFQRLDPNSEKEGTGIGLTLCRRIVHRFGGDIAVESEPGRGTTMVLILRGA